MSLKKVLVTGGAGFIGSHTAVELVNAGYEPVIVDNFSNSFPFVLDNLSQIVGRSLTFYEADCNDKEAMGRIFAKEQFYGVIHFAAYKAVGESVQKPLAYYHNNVGSLVVLLELMAEHKVKHLVFSSSCTVYGEPEKLPVDENAPVQKANSPYGNTKQICEEVIQDTVASGQELKAIALRYFNPIGAHETSLIGELPIGVPNNLVPFITQTAAGIRKELTVFGDDYDTRDGSCVRDYIHVVDLAKAHVRAIAYASEQSETSLYDTFNLGTGDGSTVLELVHAFEKATGEKLNYVVGPRRSGDVEKVYADVTKSSEVLGWKTEISVEDALRDAWNWQLKVKDQVFEPTK